MYKKIVSACHLKKAVRTALMLRTLSHLIRPELFVRFKMLMVQETKNHWFEPIVLLQQHYLNASRNLNR